MILTNAFLLLNSWSARRVRKICDSVSQKPSAWYVVVEFHRETSRPFNLLLPFASETLPLHLRSPKVNTDGTTPTGVKDEWCWWFSSDTAFPKLRFPEPSATRLRLLENKVSFYDRLANERSRGRSAGWVCCLITLSPRLRFRLADADGILRFIFIDAMHDLAEWLGEDVSTG